MTYRTPTFQESFPLSHKIDLTSQQSEYLVNNSLSKGGLASGFIGMPITIPVRETLNNEMPDGKTAASLVRNYVKHNWKVMLTCAIIGAAALTMIYIIQEENKKKKKQKIIFN
jgi:hypothetical protein